MRVQLFLGVTAVFLSALVCAAAAEDRARPSATPIIVHQRVEDGCELVQRGQFLQYPEYAAIEIEGVPTEVYSLELGSNDSVESADRDSKVAKRASKAGFVVKTSSGENLTEFPRIVALSPNIACPSVQEAITSADKHREIRRTAIQARIYRLGSDVTPPLPLSTPPPRAVQRSEAPGAATTSTSAKPNVKDGTVVLAIAIGVDGQVKDAKVARSLDPVLDTKAIEEVRRWTFRPARKKGLPVPVQVSVEVNFHLY